MYMYLIPNKTSMSCCLNYMEQLESTASEGLKKMDRKTMKTKELVSHVTVPSERDLTILSQTI